MVPGEYLLDGADIELNADRQTVVLQVNNTGDRPVQIGSHFHFFEVNKAIVFDREQAYGMRLDLPAGTAVRLEPGEVKEVRLVVLAGERVVYGLNGLVSGSLDDPKVKARALAKVKAGDFSVGTESAPRARATKKKKKKGRKARE